MLDQYINEMWFRTAAQDESAQAAVKKVVKAQQNAVDNLDDFKFCLNIAVDQNNVERNPVNAGNIFKYFEKEIEPSWKKLDERLRLACRLDWYGALFRAMADISKIPHALSDRQSVIFAKTMDLGRKWNETLAQYEALDAAAPEEEKLTGFNAYLAKMKKDLIEPQIAVWSRAGKHQALWDAVKGLLGLVVLCLVIAAIVSYAKGVGIVARLLGNEKIEVYTDETIAAEKIEGFQSYAPVNIADYNASSIRPDEDGMSFTDRYLMDGDPATAWEEGEDDAGINRRLYFNIDDEGPVHYLVIRNGNQSGTSAFRECNRLKDVTVRINDKNHNYQVTLADTDKPQYIRIARNDVQKFWIIINSVYEGTDPGNHSAVSEVEIY